MELGVGNAVEETAIELRNENLKVPIGHKTVVKQLLLQGEVEKRDRLI